MPYSKDKTVHKEYKTFLGVRINTKFGPALIKSVSGKIGTLAYETVDGVGWVDLSGEFDVIK